MPDPREVFEMATKTVRPDPGVEERQHRKQRTHAIRQKAGAYSVVAAVLIAATVFGVVTLGGDERGRPAAEGQLTRESLAGTWRMRGVDPASATLLTFSTEGGSFELALEEAAALQDASPLPFRLRGTYQIEEDTLTLTDPDQCQEMKWTARLPAEGILEFTITDTGLRVGPAASPDSCTAPLGSNVQESQTFAFERVSPRSPATADLDTGGRAEDGARPSVLGDLAGVWLIDDGNKLLRIDLFADNVANFQIWGGGALPFVEDDAAGLLYLEGFGRESDTPGVAEGSLVLRCGERNPPTVWENVLISGDAFAADVPSGGCGDLPEGRVSWLRIAGQGDYR